MTLDEYEVMFMQERAKRRRRMKVLIFVAGMVCGQITGIVALALVSVSRRDDGR
jgi:hypothetical protein